MPPNGLTIAIPNWNHELMLARSITSALNSLKAIRACGGEGEVLVVDDTSRDGSIVLLRQLEALHFVDGLRILALGKNGGLAAARNQALEHARYRHVGFVDADDELVPENVSILWRALQDTEAAAAYGNILRRIPATNEVYQVYSHESVADRLFGGNYITSFGIFDRGQLLDVGGYNANFGTLEDYEMWLHLACSGRRIVFVPVVLGYYDTSPNSMIADRTSANQAEKKVHRIFDQFKARRFTDLNTRRLCYHPDVGYL